jgi:AcrR family transcriptional regulator
MVPSDPDVNTARLDVNVDHCDVNDANLHGDVIGVNMIPMKEPRTPARASYHHGDLRTALLDTALRLVAERGPEGFSLREAAREVGVSPAAAYRHFADKPALLAALAAQGHGHLAEHMENAALRVGSGEPDPGRAVARFMAIGEAYIDFAVKHPSFFRVMFGPALKAEGFEPCCSPSGQDAYAVLGGTLDELVASGAVPADRRAGAEIGTWAAVHGLATLIVDGALPLTARQRGEAYRALIRGLLLGLGYQGALLPAAALSWKGPHPGHERHHAHVALVADRPARRGR